MHTQRLTYPKDLSQ